MSIQDWVQENFASLECSALKTAGEMYYYKAFTSKWAGPEFLTYGAIAAAIEATYAALGCNEEPLPDPPEQPEDPCNAIEGVKSLKPGFGGKIMFTPCDYEEADPEYLGYCAFSVDTDVNEILYVLREPNANGPDVDKLIVGYKRVDQSVKEINGLSAKGTNVYIYAPEEQWETVVGKDEQCPTPPPDGPLGPDDEIELDDGCKWTISPIDSYVDNQGLVHTQFRATTNDPACGDPYEFWTSIPGPTPDPEPPGYCKAGDQGPPGPKGEKGDPGNDGRDGAPGKDGIDGTDGAGGCDCDTINARFDKVDNKLGSMDGKLGEILDSVKGDGEINLLDLIDIITDLTELISGNPWQDEVIPSTSYRINGVCEYTDEDNPEQPFTEVILPPQPWKVRVLNAVEALPDLLQAHLGYRTPTCNSNDKPTLEGQWVSTHWVSDGDSANGTDKLRKLFRYRTKSTRDTGELQSFWAGLTWEAGPALVQHKGAWWGTPAVWAANEAEGKRVIRFAGGEAGIDPDMDGEWVVGSSRSTRIGMTGTMRLAQKFGEYWVTSRDGASGNPDLEPDP